MTEIGLPPTAASTQAAGDQNDDMHANMNEAEPMTIDETVDAGSAVARQTPFRKGGRRRTNSARGGSNNQAGGAAAPSSAQRLNWRDPLNLQVVASGGHTGKTPSQLAAVLGRAEVQRPLTTVKKNSVNARDPLGIDPAMVVTATPAASSVVVGPQPLMGADFRGGNTHRAPNYHHRRHGSRDKSPRLAPSQVSKKLQNVDDQHEHQTTTQTPIVKVAVVADDSIRDTDLSATSSSSAANIHEQVHVHPPAKYSKDDQARFRYGNYCRYYGKRLVNARDERLDSIDADWITGKDVLDVGCNDGTLTCQFARELKARSVVGVDIDRSLVNTARQRVRVLADKMNFANAAVGAPAASADELSSIVTASSHFPSNISFVHGDFVLRSDELLDNIQAEYDTVVAFSVTKWVHVNNGDAGLRRFFKRCYRCLRPGGRLLLEPQPWSSYERRKCTVLPEMRAHYNAIHFKPSEFVDYLLSDQVGFRLCMNMVSTVNAKGYNRPLKMFQKLPTSFDSLSIVRAPAVTTAIDDDDQPMSAQQPAAGSVKDMNEQRKRPPPAYIDAPVEKRMRTTDME